MDAEMNVHLNKDGNNKFCIRKSSNRNGVYEADFSLENRLACQNTKIRKKEKTMDMIVPDKNQKHL